MIRDALRYEWARLTTIRSTWWLTGAALVVGIGLALLISALSAHEFGKNPPSGSDIEGLGPFVVTQLAATGQVPSLVGFLLAIVGIFAWGHEYRHGMIRASLTALRSREALWVAKYVVVGAWVVVAQLVTMLVSGVIGEVLLDGYASVLDGATFQTMAWQLLSTLLLTWLAMAFTSLTRSQAFALTAIFLWPLLVENVIRLVFVLVPSLNDAVAVTRLLPFSAQRRMTDVLSEASGTFGDPLSAVGGTVIFGGLTVVLMIAAYVAFTRRDA
ncbi:ABC transporter [Marmoricola endophyticus]|uniref:ABC transporter n=1 Tax=Marmoricola endophyticus TaxID=2040280 RepID=A0A917BI04_9ACTN|nr:ABC transporter permease [Marmoricola endophyticus]GGF42031.1 ABC transporter [Marmoricola endophyticus]